MPCQRSNASEKKAFILPVARLSLQHRNKTNNKWTESKVNRGSALLFLKEKTKNKTTSGLHQEFDANSSETRILPIRIKLD